MERYNQAICLFEEQRYAESFEIFTDLYNTGDAREQISEILTQASYEPNEQEMRENYNRNVETLKKYPYIWDKEFISYDELNFTLFPFTDELYYCYHKEKDYFLGVYGCKTRHQMRYFFDNLNNPIKVEDEDNLYNLEFLNDNVRLSNDVAKDNHIYLMYSSREPLERLMLTCDLSEILEQEKFVFLIGKDNWDKYPINFKNQFNLDYRKMVPGSLRIEEINRIYLNQFYGYSGTDFFQGILNGSNHILVINNWLFYESSPDIVQTYLYYIQHPDNEIVVSEFLKAAEERQEEIKINGWDDIIHFLPNVLKGREKVKVHELWKAIIIAAMKTSEKHEGKHYNSRIVPIIFYDPHGAPCSKYYELMKYFKYPAIEATIREPIMTLMRTISVSRLGSMSESLKAVLSSTYTHSKDMPRWLTDKGFYVAKFEDLKTKPEATVKAVCEAFNIPFSDKLLIGELGMWCVRFTNEKGETLIGFDQRSVNRDISDMMMEDDREKLNLFYWPIHKYFRYPCNPERAQISKEDIEILFHKAFLFEQKYELDYIGIREELRIAPPEKYEEIKKVLEENFVLEPSMVRYIVKTTMVNGYVNGFDKDLALPEVIFPINEREPRCSQAQRLREVEYNL